MTKAKRITTPISVRLSAAELRTLRAAARSAGEELSTWLRSCAMSHAAARAKRTKAKLKAKVES